MKEHFSEVLNKKSFKIIFEVTVKRFLEILGINVGLSALVTALNFLGVLNNQQQIFYALSATVFLSIAINVYFMRNYYFGLGNRFRYYVTNYAAYLAFFVVNLAVGVIFDNNVYAWLFSITKFARFSHYMWSSLVSATLFIVLNFASIHLAPIGMGYIFQDDEV